MTYNPGLLFYKHYYEKFDFRELVYIDEAEDKKARDRRHKKFFKVFNDKICSTSFEKNLLKPIEKEGIGKIRLKTTYPGLILGTGYTHGIGIAGEFKIGFYFDHTTGLPVIPGSSVKGLLRSVFPMLYQQKAQQLNKKGSIAEAEFWDDLAKNRREFILTLLKALNYKTDGKADFIDRLELEIFEGMHGSNRESKDDHFPMSDRDIFHDAVIVSSDSNLIFEDDFITPHKNTKGDEIADELKNPLPIQFLKIKPGVTFEFQFDLKPHYRKSSHDEKIENIARLLTVSERKDLFHQILLFLGAGAKTNTGFGHFEADERVHLGETKPEMKPETDSTSNVTEKEQTQSPASNNPQGAKKASPTFKFDRQLSGNKNIIGELIKTEGDKGFFKLVNVEGFDKEVEITHGMISRLIIGEQYSINVGKVDPDKYLIVAQIGSFIALKQKFIPKT